MIVNVYRNLSPQFRGQRAWSIMAVDGPNKGKVIDIVDGAIVRDVTLVVKEAARQRVIHGTMRNGKLVKEKNVHAFVQGTLVKTFPLDTLKKSANGNTLAPGKGATVEFNYNPYHAGHFFRKDNGRAIGGAPLVVIAPEGVFAATPTALRGLAGLASFSGDWPTDASVDDWNG